MDKKWRGIISLVIGILAAVAVLCVGYIQQQDTNNKNADIQNTNIKKIDTKTTDVNNIHVYETNVQQIENTAPPILTEPPVLHVVNRYFSQHRV